MLGCGVNVCYPGENAGLKKEIEENGLVLSEYLPDEDRSCIISLSATG